VLLHHRLAFIGVPGHRLGGEDALQRTRCGAPACTPRRPAGRRQHRGGGLRRNTGGGLLLYRAPTFKLAHALPVHALRTAQPVACGCGLASARLRLACWPCAGGSWGCMGEWDAQDHSNADPP
jgi:hypothetical protein